MIYTASIVFVYLITSSLYQGEFDHLSMVVVNDLNVNFS